MMLKCSKCLVIKDESQFTRNKHYTRGRNYQCKFCMKRTRHLNSEQAEHKRIYMKEFRLRNRERAIKSRKKYRKENKEKTLAQLRLNKLFQYKIQKPVVNCFHCKAKIAEHFHHFDYSKFYEAIPLCGLCHRRFHAGIIELDCQNKMIFGDNFILTNFMERANEV